MFLYPCYVGSLQYQGQKWISEPVLPLSAGPQMMGCTYSYRRLQADAGELFARSIVKYTASGIPFQKLGIPATPCLTTPKGLLVTDTSEIKDTLLEGSSFGFSSYPPE